MKKILSEVHKRRFKRGFIDFKNGVYVINDLQFEKIQNGN